MPLCAARATPMSPICWPLPGTVARRLPHGPTTLCWERRQGRQHQGAVVGPVLLSSISVATSQIYVLCGLVCWCWCLQLSALVHSIMLHTLQCACAGVAWWLCGVLQTPASALPRTAIWLHHLSCPCHAWLQNTHPASLSAVGIGCVHALASRNVSGIGLLSAISARVSVMLVSLAVLCELAFSQVAWPHTGSVQLVT